MKSMTHAELVQRAAKWLAKKHPIVVTEMWSAAGLEPDAIGFRGQWSTMIECKASRADFFANGRKPGKQMGAFRYFMVPIGLVTREEVPKGWGLLEVDGRTVYRIVDAEQLYDERDIYGELTLLTSCIRRIGQTPPAGVSVKCYTIETKNRATLGICKES